jgi:uncharacterized SAM-binding protein YcdF (DUF218 family)
MANMARELQSGQVQAMETKKAARRARACLAVMGAVLLAGAAVTCTPLAYLYAWPLREAAAPAKSDAIVLMSAGQIGPEWLSPDAAQRTWGAVKLYREGYGRAIVSSGSQHAKGLSQAELQAEWLKRAGVPGEAITVEAESTRSYESCVAVARLMRERGWGSAAVVTSEMDVPRLRLVFRKLGVRVSFLAAREYGVPRHLIYFPAGPSVFYHATYEYAGLILYAMKGWI